jgi:hypothetical protein
MVLLDKREELPDLIWLRLALHRLEVQPLDRSRMPVDVMASPNTVEFEPASLDQPLEIREPYVRYRASNETLKESLRVHRRRIRMGYDRKAARKGRLSRPARPGGFALGARDVRGRRADPV